MSRLIAASAVVAAGAIGVGVLLGMVHQHAGFARWDARLAQFGADHASEWTTRVLLDVSFVFGSTPGVIMLGLAVGAIEMIRRPSRAVPLFLAVALGGQLLLSNSIKLIVERARPDILPLSAAAGTSFPSGHTTAAAASMATFALLLGRGRSRRTKVVLAAIAGGLAASVACSRVFLGVHWFTDVLAGLALGWGWFAVCSIAFGGRLLHFGAPVEVGPRPSPSDRPWRSPVRAHWNETSASVGVGVAVVIGAGHSVSPRRSPADDHPGARTGAVSSTADSQRTAGRGPCQRTANDRRAPSPAGTSWTSKLVPEPVGGQPEWQQTCCAGRSRVGQSADLPRQPAGPGRGGARQRPLDVEPSTQLDQVAPGDVLVGGDGDLHSGVEGRADVPRAPPAPCARLRPSDELRRMGDVGHPLARRLTHPHQLADTEEERHRIVGRRTAARSARGRPGR